MMRLDAFVAAMTKTLKIVSRSQLDPAAWNACVCSSPQRIVYGYAWYLDAVLPAPDWKWVGLVQVDEAGNYRAVMPVPLRRKRIAGMLRKWVVHQPFFCQYVDVFSHDKTLDPQPFFDLMIHRFRYGSVYATRCTFKSVHQNVGYQFHTTHTLNLQVSYETLYQNYSRDRKVNLRRAVAADWTLVNSTNLKPLLALFQKHHTASIEGGVAEWAYTILRNLVGELSKRGMARLQYAVRDGRIEAGALFCCEGNRVIYLFNAASPIGRRGNARTLLIDQFIQEKAEQELVFDFESPIKPSIRAFYQSFGADEDPFVSLRWNRLSRAEKALLTLKRKTSGWL